MTLQATTTTDLWGQFSTTHAPVWFSVNSPTTTPDTQEHLSPSRRGSLGKTDVELLRSEGDTGGPVIKRYWCELPNVMRHPLRFLVSEEQLGLPGDAVASTTSRPKMCQSEPDAKVWRGVFSPPYRRKALFSQSVEIRTADLPKWKPHITIDRRTLARTEDE